MLFNESALVFVVRTYRPYARTQASPRQRVTLTEVEGLEVVSHRVNFDSMLERYCAVTSRQTSSEQIFENGKIAAETLALFSAGRRVRVPARTSDKNPMEAQEVWGHP